tara:strand:- start:1023 stop:1223 length:201 start_codon:yes stop_codon:yes gene_type:complete
MTEVNVKNGQLESALKALRRRTAKEKTMIEIRDRRFYIKPSRVNYEKKRKAKYAAKMQAAEDRLWR